jgi:hypothetical protein
MLTIILGSELGTDPRLIQLLFLLFVLEQLICLRKMFLHNFLFLHTLNSLITLPIKDLSILLNPLWFLLEEYLPLCPLLKFFCFLLGLYQFVNHRSFSLFNKSSLLLSNGTDPVVFPKLSFEYFKLFLDLITPSAIGHFYMGLYLVDLQKLFVAWSPTAGLHDMLSFFGIALI